MLAGNAPTPRRVHDGARLSLPGCLTLLTRRYVVEDLLCPALAVRSRRGAAIVTIGTALNYPRPTLGPCCRSNHPPRDRSFPRQGFACRTDVDNGTNGHSARQRLNRARWRSRERGSRLRCSFRLGRSGACHGDRAARRDICGPEIPAPRIGENRVRNTTPLLHPLTGAAGFASLPIIPADHRQQNVIRLLNRQTCIDALVEAGHRAPRSRTPVAINIAQIATDTPQLGLQGLGQLEPAHLDRSL